jgi:hypothetical protein
MKLSQDKDMQILRIEDFFWVIRQNSRNHYNGSLLRPCPPSLEPSLPLRPWVAQEVPDAARFPT